MVRVFVNLEGLEQTCVDLHLSHSYGTVRQFASGFTQNQPLFDFVDAGRGKERADHKIKGVTSRCYVLGLELIGLFLIELFSLFVQNTHCKHIVLGCCHDNGYVVTLDPHRLDVVTASRITLLQGPRVGREYSVLPFEILQLNGLFRQTPLASDTTIFHQARTEGPPINVSRAPVRSHGRANEGFVEQRTTFHLPAYPRSILLNRDDQRVDGYLPEPTTGDTNNLHRRLEHLKICNEYTLKGHCAIRPCVFAHISDLSRGEVYAQAKRIRLTPCVAGSACRSFQCFYGHVCPHGAGCTKGNKCQFKKVHVKDTTAVAELIAPSGGGTNHHVAH